MAVEPLRNSFLGILGRIGRSALHSIYPNEIEIYSIAFELVDSQNRTIDLLIFPVMPESIEYTEPTLTNIKKTTAGVVSQTTDSYVPADINLSGTFGRKFRFLVGAPNRAKQVIAAGFNYNRFKSKEFSSVVKTGYGVIKILQSILQASQKLSASNEPYRLFFYNLAFNQAFLVEVTSSTFSQARESSNMIWNYNVTLKTLAPLDDIKDLLKQRVRILSLTFVQQTINLLARTIVGAIANRPRRTPVNTTTAPSSFRAQQGAFATNSQTDPRRINRLIL